MYTFIINPKTNRKVSIFSRLGKNIVNKYINKNNVFNLQKGGSKFKKGDNELIKTLKDFNIVYINLDSRPERADSIEKQLRKNGLNATRISAINGKKLRDKSYRQKIAQELDIANSENLSPNFWMNRSNFKTMIKKEDPILGRVGCFLSHMKVMKTALEKGWDNVLVLEDDVMILPGSSDAKINIPDTDNVDIHYFGGMFWHSGKNDFKTSAVQPKNPDTSWINVDPKYLKLIGTFAYSVNNPQKMQDIYNFCKSVFIGGKGHDKHDEWRSGNIKMRAQAMDFLYINHFQKNGQCMVRNPVLFSHFENMGSDISPHYGTSSGKWKHSFFYHPDQEKKMLKMLNKN